MRLSFQRSRSRQDGLVRPTEWGQNKGKWPVHPVLHNVLRIIFQHELSV